MQISLDKQYTTRDGHAVRIYAVDGSSNYPVHGAILYKDGWRLYSWTITGVYSNGSIDIKDLIEIKPIQDKDPVYAWDNSYTHLRVSGFYDKINKRLFDIDGLRGGVAYSNYELIENPPQWMIEAQKTLED